MSETAKFTPGPLVAEEYLSPKGRWLIRRDGERGVLNYPLTEGNAKLWASAPDLLEASRPFEEIIQEGSEDLPDDTPVVVKIGERVLDMTLTLENFRALQRAVLKAEVSS